MTMLTIIDATQFLPQTEIEDDGQKWVVLATSDQETEKRIKGMNF